jgi:hypothetical protein
MANLLHLGSICVLSTATPIYFRIQVDPSTSVHSLIIHTCCSFALSQTNIASLFEFGINVKLATRSLARPGDFLDRPLGGVFLKLAQNQQDLLVTVGVLNPSWTRAWLRPRLEAWARARLEAWLRAGLDDWLRAGLEDWLRAGL